MRAASTCRTTTGSWTLPLSRRRHWRRADEAVMSRWLFECYQSGLQQTTRQWCSSICTQSSNIERPHRSFVCIKFQGQQRPHGQAEQAIAECMVSEVFAIQLPDDDEMVCARRGDRSSIRQGVGKSRWTFTDPRPAPHCNLDISGSHPSRAVFDVPLANLHHQHGLMRTTDRDA